MQNTDGSLGVYLEVFHKKLKLLYGWGKTRAEKCVSFLLKPSTNMIFEHVIREKKSNNRYRRVVVTENMANGIIEKTLNTEDRY